MLLVNRKFNQKMAAVKMALVAVVYMDNLVQLTKMH